MVQTISQPALRADRRGNLLQHGEAFLRRKQRRLAGMNADREHQPVGEPDGTFHDVEMAIGDGVERPGEKGCARHGGGLARGQANRKAIGYHPEVGG